MIKATIKNQNGEITNEAVHKTTQDAMAWISEGEEKNWWPENFSSQLIDVTDVEKRSERIRYGLAAQEFGRYILAKVHASNEEKLESGLLSVTQFQALMANSNLEKIERALMNGSLKTCAFLISQIEVGYFTESEKLEMIQEINDFLMKWGRK